jgi:CRP-like cAMP-binding protein
MQCCVSSRVRRQEEDEQYRKKSEANKRKQLQAYDDMLRRMGRQEDDEMHAAARSHLKSIHREQVEQDLDLAVDQRMATRPEPRRLSQHEQEKADARALPKKHLKRERARRGLATAGPRDVLLKRLVVAINQAHVAKQPVQPEAWSSRDGVDIDGEGHGGRAGGGGFAGVEEHRELDGGAELEPAWTVPPLTLELEPEPELEPKLSHEPEPEPAPKRELSDARREQQAGRRERQRRQLEEKRESRRQQQQQVALARRELAAPAQPSPGAEAAPSTQKPKKFLSWGVTTKAASPSEPALARPSMGRRMSVLFRASEPDRAEAPVQATAPATLLPPQRLRLVRPGLLSPRDTRTVAQELAISATLRTLGEAELVELAPRCTRTARKPGEAVVIQGGSDSQAMYIVVEGLLRVTVRAEDGEEQEVATLRAGETFGEQSLLLSRPRTATVETVTDCVLLEISRGVLAPLLRLQPTLAMRLAELHASRTHSGSGNSGLEQTVKLICESFGIAKKRVLMEWTGLPATALAESSSTRPGSGQQLQWADPAPTGRPQLAHETGAAVESVSEGQRNIKRQSATRRLARHVRRLDRDIVEVTSAREQYVATLASADAQWLSKDSSTSVGGSRSLMSFSGIGLA